MAKILTGRELADIVVRATDPKNPEIDDRDQYEKFVKDLAVLVTDHFGGRIGRVDWEDELGDMLVAISKDENVPEDGGVYQKYDVNQEDFS